MTNRKAYDKSFKAEAVKLAEETSIPKAAKSLGLPENTLRNWIARVQSRPDNPFIGSGHKYIAQQDAEKAELLKEIKELKRANEILKEALGFSPRAKRSSNKPVVRVYSYPPARAPSNTEMPYSGRYQAGVLPMETLTE